MVGTQLGAYTVLKQIGEGGMGSVWLAEHTMLGRRAAIKVLHPMYTAREDIVARFFNEARAATAISDPGIVQVFDFGHAADGSAYIVMELLDGEPLDKRLARLGVVPVTDALRIMRQVATSLGAAHERGIVHRDLKPENIFLVRDAEVSGGERPKILDFGIAKLTGDTKVKTNTAAMMGTPTYMSPEQCRGAGQVDARADVYSLGCVLFQLVTGRPPFDADGVGEIIAMHLREPPPLPSSRAAGIPPELDQLILSCLAKDPAHRFASAAALAGALGAMLGLASQPEPVRTAPDETARAPSASPAISALSTAPPARSRRTVAVIAIGVAGLCGAGGWVVVHGGGSSPAPAADAAVPAVPADAAVVIAPPPRDAAPPPAPGDDRALVAAGMAQLFASFQRWAPSHAGAPCPDATALGGPLDPWGKPFQITCTEQPARQIIGAISLGPDGVLGTHDDLDSWQFAGELTDLVRGAHWSSAPHAGVTIPHAGTAPPPPKSPPAAAPTPSPDPAPTPAKPDPAPTPPKPGVELDANGFPKHR